MDDLATASRAGHPFINGWIESCSGLMIRREHFAAADFDSARQRILEFSNGRSAFTVADPCRFVRFSEACAYIGRLAVRFLSWDCETACETDTFRTPDHHLSLHIPLKGVFEARQGDHSVHVRPGQAVAISAPGKTVRLWHGSCYVLNIMIEKQTVDWTTAEEPSPRIKGRLDHQPLTVIDLEAAPTLTRLLETIIHDLGCERPVLLEPAIANHFERALMLVVLKSIRDQSGGHPQEDTTQIAPFYVRRAERYIHDFHHQKIELPDLVRASGVSTRTLYYGFRKYRDVSPMQHIRIVRLVRARHMLLDGETRGHPIGTIAANVGYQNKSQFARDYKSHFGESPTATANGRAATSPRSGRSTVPGAASDPPMRSK